ncbi:hypothetical protein HN011_006399 [Eciton burchellii]|nr:hypothetical protein HN011_006399 [Eciton burchellii]
MDKKIEMKEENNSIPKNKTMDKNFFYSVKGFHNINLEKKIVTSSSENDVSKQHSKHKEDQKRNFDIISFSAPYKKLLNKIDRMYKGKELSGELRVRILPEAGEIPYVPWETNACSIHRGVALLGVELTIPVQSRVQSKMAEMLRGVKMVKADVTPSTLKDKY